MMRPDRINDGDFMFKIKLDSYSKDDEKKVIGFAPQEGDSKDPVRFATVVKYVLTNLAVEKSRTANCIDINLLNSLDRDNFILEMGLMGYLPVVDTSPTISIPDILVYKRDESSFDEISTKSIDKSIEDMRDRISNFSAQFDGVSKS